VSDEVGSNRIAQAHPGRTAGVIALVAALLLAGVLLLERSGASPVQNLRNISSGQPAKANAAGPVGQTPIVVRPSAPQTRLADASISAAGKSQITDAFAAAEAICPQFLAGTAPTLSTVNYDTTTAKGITSISKVSTTGNFFYWVSIPVASPGTQSFTITQSTTYGATSGDPFFEPASGGKAYDGNCNDLQTTITGGGASVTVGFTAATAGTYIIGLKDSTKSIIGSSPASSTPGFTYGYTFSTTGVSGSTQGLNLTHV
jgi:hypothetical protein